MSRSLRFLWLLLAATFLAVFPVAADQRVRIMRGKYYDGE